MRETRRRLGAFASLIAIVMLEATQCAPPPPRSAPARLPTPLPKVQPCPPEMAEVALPSAGAGSARPSHSGASSAFCIDRYEASIARRSAAGTLSDWPSNQPVDGSEAEIVAVCRAGRKPQGYISGAQAELACERANKRLCSAEEWVTACRGPQHTRYPYGDVRRASVCNDRFGRATDHPVARLFKASAVRGQSSRKMWTPSFMNDPRLLELPDTVAASGAFPGCTNEYGAFDMVGNLHEWVADRQGSFLGGYFMDTLRNGEGCAYRTTAHAFGYHDYSTGFRCCADAASATVP